MVSTVCLHATAWVLLTYYATDYLPPLAIRATVGLSAARSVQFLVGYLTLSAVCLVLGTGFGNYYRPRIAASRYPWRWYLFPLIAALVLIPAQGENELLTAAVEALFLLGGMAAGRALPSAFRRSRKRAAQGPAVGP